MANVSREQFDETRAVQQKIFQNGSHLLDADLNEQIDIALDNRRRSLSCLVGHKDMRFDAGFSIEEHASDLTVTIKAGQAAFHLDDGHAALLHHHADSTLSGFSSWVSGGVERTDLIYIDIEEVEVSATSDANLVNPIVGEETCRDIRIEYSIKIAEDTTTLPTAPDGHVYRELGRITKDDSSDKILDAEIIVSLSDYRKGTLSTLEIPVWRVASESHDGNETMDLDNANMQYKATSVSGLVAIPVIKIPYVYDPSHQYLVLHCEAWKDAGCGDFRLHLQGSLPLGAGSAYITSFSPTQAAAYLDLTKGTLWGIPTAGDMYTLSVALLVYGGGSKSAYIQRPVIMAGLGPMP